MSSGLLRRDHELHILDQQFSGPEITAPLPEINVATRRFAHRTKYFEGHGILSMRKSQPTVYVTSVNVFVSTLFGGLDFISG